MLNDAYFNSWVTHTKDGEWLKLTQALNEELHWLVNSNSVVVKALMRVEANRFHEGVSQLNNNLIQIQQDLLDALEQLDLVLKQVCDDIKEAQFAVYHYSVSNLQSAIQLYEQLFGQPLPQCGTHTDYYYLNQAVMAMYYAFLKIQALLYQKFKQANQLQETLERCVKVEPDQLTDVLAWVHTFEEEKTDSVKIETILHLIRTSKAPTVSSEDDVLTPREGELTFLETILKFLRNLSSMKEKGYCNKSPLASGYQSIHDQKFKQFSINSDESMQEQAFEFELLKAANERRQARMHTFLSLMQQLKSSLVEPYCEKNPLHRESINKEVLAWQFTRHLKKQKGCDIVVHTVDSLYALVTACIEQRYNLCSDFEGLVVCFQLTTQPTKVVDP